MKGFWFCVVKEEEKEAAATVAVAAMAKTTAQVRAMGEELTRYLDQWLFLV